MLTAEQHAVQTRIIEAINAGIGTIVLPGAPGTGRFTLVRETADLLEAQGKSCLFVAPTGKAAAVLRSRGRCNAKTIHALMAGVGNGEMPVQDMVVVEHASLAVLPQGSPTVDELYDALRKTCKALVVLTEPDCLYDVVSTPALEPEGLAVFKPLTTVMRQIRH